MLSAGLYADVDSAHILLGGDINICGGAAAGQLAVGAIILSALRNPVQVHNFHQYSLLNFTIFDSSPFPYGDLILIVKLAAGIHRGGGAQDLGHHLVPRSMVDDLAVRNDDNLIRYI